MMNKLQTVSPQKVGLTSNFSFKPTEQRLTPSKSLVQLKKAHAGKHQQIEFKDFSIHSISTNRKTAKNYRTKAASCFQNQHNYSNITNQDRQKYDAIQRILRQQNQNLKQQNQLLLAEVYKLKGANKKFKQLYSRQRLDLQEAQEECQAQKRRADQMKEIIMSRLMSLEGNFLSGQANMTASDCQSLLQALELSSSGYKA